MKVSITVEAATGPQVQRALECALGVLFEERLDAVALDFELATWMAVTEHLSNTTAPVEGRADGWAYRGLPVRLHQEMP